MEAYLFLEILPQPTVVVHTVCVCFLKGIDTVAPGFTSVSCHGLHVLHMSWEPLSARDHQKSFYTNFRSSSGNIISAWEKIGPFPLPLSLSVSRLSPIRAVTRVPRHSACHLVQKAGRSARKPSKLVLSGRIKFPRVLWPAC